MLLQPQSGAPPLELKPARDPRKTGHAATAPEAHSREVAT
jgi:hypothetical protein